MLIDLPFKELMLVVNNRSAEEGAGLAFADRIDGLAVWKVGNCEIHALAENTPDQRSVVEVDKDGRQWYGINEELGRTRLLLKTEEQPPDSLTLAEWERLRQFLSSWGQTIAHWELVFKGEPLQFARVVGTISGRLARTGGPSVSVWYNQRDPDPVRSKIELVTPEPERGQIGQLEALKTGDGNSSVAVTGVHDVSVFAGWWGLIIAELQRQGWIDTQQPATTDAESDGQGGQAEQADIEGEAERLQRGIDRLTEERQGVSAQCRR